MCACLVDGNNCGWETYMLRDKIYYENFATDDLFFMQGRGLITIPPNIPSGIIHLSLYANKIASIGPYTFSSHSSLEILDLLANHISKIDVNAFYGLHKVRSLDLGSSRTALLEPGVFDRVGEFAQEFSLHLFER